MPFAFLFHDHHLGNDTPMTEPEMINICLSARYEILLLQEQAVKQQSREILRLELALSCALPTVDDKTAALILSAIEYRAPPRGSMPILVVDNGRTQ